MEKMRKELLVFFAGLFLLVNFQSGICQKSQIADYMPDYKVIESYSPSNGYYFVPGSYIKDPENQYYLSIIDNYGTPVFFKLTENPSLHMKLSADYVISYIDGKQRYLKVLDDHLKLVDSISTENYSMDTHDYYITSGGHFILIGVAPRIVDMSQYVEGGQPNATILDFVIQEFDENKNLLYTWMSEEHYNILDGNEESIFVVFTDGTVDYAHVNSVTADSDTSLLISCRHMDEITRVDRRTGDIIWRLGGKNNDFVFINDDIGFSHQHSIHKLPNGNILLFDNGNMHDLRVSSSVEYELDEVNMTATLVKRIRREPDIYLAFTGTTQDFAGNTIFGWGNKSPSFTEFNPDGTIAIEIDYNDHSFSRGIYKYEWENVLFSPSVDSVDFGLWPGGSAMEDVVSLTNHTGSPIMITGYSTHSDDFYLLNSLPLEVPAFGNVDLTIAFNPVDAVYSYINDVITLNSDTKTQRISCQVFLHGSRDDFDVPNAWIQPDSMNVPLQARITIFFSEPIRQAGGEELSYPLLKDFIILRKDDQLGEQVLFDANISVGKDKIIIKPLDSLNFSQQYYVSFTDDFEDYSGNLLSVVEQHFTTVTPVYSSSLIVDQDIVVYPNPTRGIFTIESETMRFATLEVYSSTGRLIYKGNYPAGSKVKIDLQKEASGLYLLILKDSNGVKIISKKILKF